METDTEIRNRISITSIRLILKYTIEGFVIAITAYIMMKNSRIPSVNEIFSIGLTGALSMMLLDIFAKKVGEGARLGAGLGLARNLISY